MAVTKYVITNNLSVLYNTREEAEVAKLETAFARGAFKRLYTVTVAIAKNLTSYIPMMYADNIEQGLQVCRLLKEIEPKEVYTVVSSADLSLNLEHVKDYSWKEELV